jgi:hypothetical protein
VNCGTGCSGGTQYAEDTARSSGDTLSLAGAVRQDTIASDTSADGDASFLKVNSVGRLYTATTVDAALPAGNNNIGDVDIASGTVTTVSTVTSISQLGGVALPVEDGAETNGGVGIYAMSVRRDAAAASSGTTGDNATLNTDAAGLLWTRTLDPCNGTAKTSIPINISTATTTELTAALAGASTHYYVCGLDLVAGGADNVALVDDDTDNCASPTSGLAGGTTAGSGWNFGANGGLVKGNGDSTIYKTGGTNRVLCMVTSAAVQLSGSIQVVAAP